MQASPVQVLMRLAWHVGECAECPAVTRQRAASHAAQVRQQHPRLPKSSKRIRFCLLLVAKHSFDRAVMHVVKSQQLCWTRKRALQRRPRARASTTSSCSRDAVCRDARGTASCAGMRIS